MHPCVFVAMYLYPWHLGYMPAFLQDTCFGASLSGRAFNRDVYSCNARRASAGKLALLASWLVKIYALTSDR